jgi:hypothetical protein
MLAGGTDCVVFRYPAFCENIRRAENVRLQTIYRIGRNTLVFTINDVFSIFGRSNHLLAIDFSSAVRVPSRAKRPSVKAAAARLCHSVLLRPSRRFCGMLRILAVPRGLPRCATRVPNTNSFVNTIAMTLAGSRKPHALRRGRLTDRLTPVCVALPIAVSECLLCN